MKWAQRAEAVRTVLTTEEQFQIERLGVTAAVSVAGQVGIGVVLDRNPVGARVLIAEAVSIGMPISVTFTDDLTVDQMMGFVAKCIPQKDGDGFVIGIEVDLFQRRERP